MTIGMIVVTVVSDGVLLGVGVGLLGTGLGFGAPGIMAAPTLLATREEQGAVAGLVSSSTALTFMVGPIIGNGLYEVDPVVPYILGAVLMAGLVVFTFVHRGIRQTAPQTPATVPAETSEPQLQ